VVGVVDVSLRVTRRSAPEISAECLTECLSRSQVAGGAERVFNGAVNYNNVLTSQHGVVFRHQNIAADRTADVTINLLQPKRATKRGRHRRSGYHLAVAMRPEKRQLRLALLYLLNDMRSYIAFNVEFVMRMFFVFRICRIDIV